MISGTTAAPRFDASTVAYLGDGRVVSAGDDFAVRYWDSRQGITRRQEYEAAFERPAALEDLEYALEDAIFLEEDAQLAEARVGTLATSGSFRTIPLGGGSGEVGFWKGFAVFFLNVRSSFPSGPRWTSTRGVTSTSQTTPSTEFPCCPASSASR